MEKYEIVTRTLTFNKPGISPTVKNGTDMGWVSGGTFTPTREINGWLDMTPNKWVMKSACRVVEPPPVDPPPVEPPDEPPIENFAPPAELMARWQTGTDSNGNPILTEYYYYDIRPA